MIEDIEDQRVILHLRMKLHKLSNRYPNIPTVISDDPDRIRFEYRAALRYVQRREQERLMNEIRMTICYLISPSDKIREDILDGFYDREILMTIIFIAWLQGVKNK